MFLRKIILHKNCILPKNIKPEDRIAFSLYTTHENTVKLNAQFYPKSKQYKSWPIKISQFDNFNPRNYFELPTFKLSKDNQVVTVIEGVTNAVVSSVRIKRSSYR